MLIFVDTRYLIAVINKHDQWHQAALNFTQANPHADIVVTDCIFVETLNYFSDYRADVKELAAKVIEKFSSQENVRLVEQNSALIEAGIRLYRSRLDKGYSLTDCISMNVARTFGISKFLSHDSHFLQEGFEILL